MKASLVSSLLLIATGAAGSVFMQELHPPRLGREKTTFGFNEGKPSLSSDAWRLISFGYPRLFSSLLWLRFLQETPVEKVPPGETSWIYYDLDSITTLDPEFFPAFEHGGIFLSVVTEDKLGAEQLFLKGTRLFPNRWKIRAYLAYHYQHELQKPELAYEQYALGARVPGAPPFLSIFAAHHVAAKESVAATIRFLEQMRDNATDEAIRKKFQDRIEAWRKKERAK